MAVYGIWKRWSTRLIIISIMLHLISPPGILSAEMDAPQSGQIIKGVQGEGSCAIVGMSAEQSQLLALQRARVSVIEQAAGVSVTSSTLVTNFILAADFIKTYARGFIVSEKVSWAPLNQYQKDSATAPIPEYRVRLSADVYVPKKKAATIGLKAKLNSSVFRNGEKATISIQTNREAEIAIFNIVADDIVSLIFPNSHERNNIIAAGKDFVFPSKNASVELKMETMPSHQRDAEAFFVIAWDRSSGIRIRDMFAETSPINIIEYFRRLSEIADYIEDVIIPYEVVDGR